MADTLLDAQGLSCPLPVLRAKKALATMAGGDRLEVLATDPGSRDDFHAFCKATGNELVEFSENAGVFRFVISKCGTGGGRDERR